MGSAGTGVAAAGCAGTIERLGAGGRVLADAGTVVGLGVVGAGFFTGVGIDGGAGVAGGGVSVASSNGWAGMRRFSGPGWVLVVIPGSVGRAGSCGSTGLGVSAGGACVTGALTGGAMG